MKKLTLLFVLSFMGLTLNAQTAVYHCKTTGAIGYCYGDSNYLNCAYNTAISYGAISPELLFSTTSKGYGAMAVGVNLNGVKVFGISAGMNNSAAARNIAIRECQKYGGRNISIKDTWFDY